MASESGLPWSRTCSRRAWLLNSLWLGGAAASLQAREPLHKPKRLPWNRPIPLGRSGLQLTRLGFGCEETKQARLIHRAVELGVNHFNSFPNHGDISHFSVVREGLRPHRSRVVLAAGSNQRTKAALLEDLDRQLRALGTDYIDLFYLVAVSKAETLTDELLEALRKARESGKIRAGGLSTHGFAAVLPRLVKCSDTIQALMVTCNFASWDSSGWVEALPDIRRLRESGVGIVAMKPLLGGMGTPPTGHPSLTDGLKTKTGRARVMAAALRWVLQNSLVDTVPVLIRSEAELNSSVRAASKALSEDDSKLLAATVQEASRGLCRLCPTCPVKCRSGYLVSEVMRAGMYAQGYGDELRALLALGEMGPLLSSVCCETCPQCTAHCPNGVWVRAGMMRARDFFLAHASSHPVVWRTMACASGTPPHKNDTSRV